MCVQQKETGILLAVSSLPSPYGIGDLGPAARAWLELLGQNGVTIWQILFARPGTPAEALATLRDAAARALAEPAVRQRLAAAGCDTWPDSSPAAATALLGSEIARWTPIVAAMNLNPS